MTRRFECLGKTWGAAGMGTGGGSPERGENGIWFIDLSHPGRVFPGRIPLADPRDVDDAELCRALEATVKSARGIVRELAERIAHNVIHEGAHESVVPIPPQLLAEARLMLGEDSPARGDSELGDEAIAFFRAMMARFGGDFDDA